MNKKQKQILVIVAILIAVAIIFPPIRPGVGSSDIYGPNIFTQADYISYYGVNWANLILRLASIAVFGSAFFIGARDDSSRRT